MKCSLSLNSCLSLALLLGQFHQVIPFSYWLTFALSTLASFSLAVSPLHSLPFCCGSGSEKKCKKERGERRRKKLSDKGVSLQCENGIKKLSMRRRRQIARKMEISPMNFSRKRGVLLKRHSSSIKIFKRHFLPSFTGGSSANLQALGLTTFTFQHKTKQSKPSFSFYWHWLVLFIWSLQPNFIANAQRFYRHERLILVSLRTSERGLVCEAPDGWSEIFESKQTPLTETKSWSRFTPKWKPISYQK